ncbi:MAG: hypothetical protein JST12_01935 [Armatimonadetes bacterium]|nr:hypothetical protein [Armatimonadota bacterium]
MKSIHILVAALTVLTVSSASAQTTTVQKHHHANSAVSQDPNMRLIRHAMEEISKGEKALHKGLPIYQGNRANAMELGRMAHAELVIGMGEQKVNAQAKSPAKKEEDNKSPKGYTDQQIKESNVHLVIGGHFFENAIALLNKTTWESNGHKANAIADLQRALDDLKAALAPYGGASANMPKGGFKHSKPKASGVIKP